MKEINYMQIHVLEAWYALMFAKHIYKQYTYITHLSTFEEGLLTSTICMYYNVSRAKEKVSKRGLVAKHKLIE